MYIMKQSKNEEVITKEIPLTECPHCGATLQPWQPPEMTSWTEEAHYVCFNDECSYYVKGWDWMYTQFQQKVSYRFRFIPSTGEKGPLPVWSASALKDRIINE